MSQLKGKVIGVLTIFLSMLLIFFVRYAYSATTPITPPGGGGGCSCSDSNTLRCLIKAGGCYPEGCVSSCVQDCFPTHCSVNTTMCDAHGEKYYQDGDCCWPAEYSETNCPCGCSNGACICCGCTPKSCPDGTSEDGKHGLYTTYSCTDNCNMSSYRSCYCNSSCTPADCGAGTQETPVSISLPLYYAVQGGNEDPDKYGDNSCSNMCGESRKKSCYCSICSPAQCSVRGYKDLMQYDEWGYQQGQVPNGKTLSCRNGEGAPEQLSKCNITYRTCYCTSCLKQCPLPLSDTGSAKLILNDFRECTNDCSVKPPENHDDCYEEESPQPDENLIIEEDRHYTNHYGFFSNTHTGDRLSDVTKLGTLNDPFDPAIKMKAEYTDSDGASDIEGLFVWFRGEAHNEPELGTPLYISDTATPKASANDSWGFMLRRNGSSWQPYVPSYDGGNVFWTSKGINNLKVFSIQGTNGKQMVEVTIIDGPKEEIVNKKVTIVFSLRFSEGNGTLLPGNVSEGLYKIYLMGLDKFSFTPYDNYGGIVYKDYWSEGFKYHGYENLSPFWQENQLRYKAEQNQKYARDWKDTGKTWTIDRTGPTFDDKNTKLAVSGNNITVSWDVNDKIKVNENGNLNTVVGYVFSTDINPANLTIKEFSTTSGQIAPHNPLEFRPENSNGSGEKIGVFEDGSGYLFRVTNINSNTNSGYIKMNINDQATGALLFYLTVFDDAGNMVHHNQIRQDLNDWMVTSGGLAYSNGGASFTVKDLALAGEVWKDILPPINYGSNPGLNPPKVNYTSEMWAQAGGTITFNPDSPSNSYSLGGFTGLGVQHGYYTLLMDAYEKNKKNLGDTVQERNDLGSFSNPVTDYCNNEYCVFKYSSDVTTTSDFVCNKKALIFVGGSLTINPPLKNKTGGTDKLSGINGCIFVVNGGVNITGGGDAVGNFKYDKVNGYIFADGQIVIEDEGNKRAPNTDPIIDGVYINGGLQSYKGDGKSILFRRYLRLEDRLKFPLLAIDLHPKYGILGEKFFGKEYIIQAVESGVKP